MAKRKTAAAKAKTRVATRRACVERLEERTLLTGLNAVIDSFAYYSGDINSIWSASGQAAHAQGVSSGLYAKSANMSANGSGTASWSHNLAAGAGNSGDFSSDTGFQVTLYTPTPTEITNFTLSFQTSGGSYNFSVAPSQLNTTANFADVPLNMKNAAVSGNPTGWMNVASVAISETVTHAGANFYVRGLKATGTADLIDSFVYPSNSAAQAAWVSSSGGAGLATNATNIGSPPRSALQFPVNFGSNPTASNAVWGRWLNPGGLDLSWARGIEFDVYCANPTPIAYIDVSLDSSFGASDCNGEYSVSYVNMPAANSWNTIAVDLSTANISGTPLGFSEIQAATICFIPVKGADGATNVGPNTNVYLSNMRVLGGGNKSIDLFEYAGDAAAQSAWVKSSSTPAAGSALVSTTKTLPGGRGLALPVNFASYPSNTQANWDHSVSLSLAAQCGVQFDFYPTDTTSLSSMTLNLTCGNGNYIYTFAPPAAGQWTTISIPLQSFSATGSPSPIATGTITDIRISVGNNQGVEHNSTVYVRDLRTMMPQILLIWQEEGDQPNGLFQTGCGNVSAALAAAGVPFGEISDQDLIGGSAVRRAAGSPQSRRRPRAARTVWPE